MIHCHQRNPYEMKAEVLAFQFTCVSLHSNIHEQKNINFKRRWKFDGTSVFSTIQTSVGLVTFLSKKHACFSLPLRRVFLSGSVNVQETHCSRHSELFLSKIKYLFNLIAHPSNHPLQRFFQSWLAWIEGPFYWSTHFVVLPDGFNDNLSYVVGGPDSSPFSPSPHPSPTFLARSATLPTHLWSMHMPYRS